MTKIGWLILLLPLLVGCKSVCVQEQVLYYPSVSTFGDTITLSGKVSYPTNRKPAGVVLLPHFTIASNNEVPSTSTPAEARYLRDKYVLIMPDYLGYGVTCDSVHPYLDGCLAAHHCLDMLPCAQAMLDSLQVACTVDSFSIVGFSQGAAVALWTLWLLEQSDSSRYHVRACYAGSGPYDVATVYDDALMRNRVGMSMTIPMLVMGTSAAYHLNLQRADFFTPKLDAMYDKYVASKKYGYAFLYARMPDKRLSTWLSEYGRDMRQLDTRRMYEGFLRSSLVHYPIQASWYVNDTICPAWKPRAPLYVFHSENDDIVSFYCAEHLRRWIGDAPNVQYDFGRYGNHIRSLMLFMPRVVQMLDERERRGTDDE